MHKVAHQIFLAGLFYLVTQLVCAHGLDRHSLPLGDGKLSDAPRRGYVFSCMTSFHGAGAQVAGDWIHGSRWDATQKIFVQGHVLWPNARFNIIDSNTTRELLSNDLPVDSATGVFPVQQSDPAYRIDRNPNAIEQQTIRLQLPRYPQLASLPGCVPMGMIGVLLNGVALFSAVDDGGRDAVAHEVQDHCHGHPQRQGKYHYHGPSPCIPNINANAKLIGYALDGFGIYSLRDEQGNELSDADLDACHGRVSPVLWEGRRVNMYHYVMTRDYPYSIGCFRGHVQTSPFRVEHARAVPHRQAGRHGPPAIAIQACAGARDGDDCQFQSPRGDMIRGSCRSPGNMLACIPLGGMR